MGWGRGTNTCCKFQKANFKKIVKDLVSTGLFALHPYSPEEAVGGLKL